MLDNKGYGFDAHDGSDFLTIHDNEVDDNGYHGIITSKRCNGVSIQVRYAWRAVQCGSRTTKWCLGRRPNGNVVAYLMLRWQRKRGPRERETLRGCARPCQSSPARAKLLCKLHIYV